MRTPSAPEISDMRLTQRGSCVKRHRGRARVSLQIGPPSWSAGDDETDDERTQNAEKPAVAGLSDKRLKGLEPSTFCMASRRSSQLSYSRVVSAE